MDRFAPPTQSTPPTVSSSEIADRLRSDIIFGRLRPRERLVEEELCERFQTKRYSLRIAFDKLEKLDLIERRPNRGAIVKDLSIDELEELYDMRTLLQKQAIERIPADAFGPLANCLEEIQSQFKKSLEKDDLDTIAALDSLFHRELYASCGNKYLTDSIELHWQKTVCIHSYALGRSSISKISAEEHDQIIAALRAGDRKLTAKLCNEHMFLSLKAYKEAKTGWQLRD